MGKRATANSSVSRNNLLILGGVLTVLLGVLPLAANAGAAAKKPSLKQRIHSLLQRKIEKKEQAQEARQKLRVLKKKERAISSQVHETQQHLETARQQFTVVSHRLQRTQNDLRVTQRELRTVQARLARHNEVLGERLVSIYKNGSLVFIEILLDSESFSDVVKRTYLFRKIVENDLALLHNIKEEQQDVSDKHQVLKHQERQVKSAQLEAQDRKTEVADQAEKERQLLFKVRHQRAAYEDYVRELEQESQEIASMIRRLTAAPGGRRVVPWKGGFARPVAGRVSSAFGYRFHPIFHVRRFHTGVDLSAAYGSVVHAAAGGRCLFAGWKRAYGKTIVIDHGGGVATVYGHCSALLISPGATIGQGQSIARVGSTGISTGPHLHFEVRRNGAPVNPMTFR